METPIMHPESSVIVPALNEERYLERPLASITNQNTNTPYELIVSDKMSKKLGIADLRDYVGIR